MGNFAEALISKKKSILIPEEYDYWGELIGNWDMVYTCYGSMSRFTGTKKDGMVILTNNHRKTNRWIFTEITKDTFHWQNEYIRKDGTVKVWCEVFAKRQE